MADKSFWDHLDVLRWVLIRCLAVAGALAVAIFCFKDFVFQHIIFAPCADDFITYRAINRLGDLLSLPTLSIDVSQIELININLASQLMTHISVSFYLAVVLAMPYIITEVWLFVKPALYSNELRPAVAAVVAFFFQFFLGLALAYFLIFPLTFQFLGTYQVDARVVNQISLSSYISSFLGLMFTMGLVFEMPIVAFFFARIGVLKATFLRRYRKVAVIAVLMLAAFITPSTDVFTMLLVALPLYLLYEFSRMVVTHVEKKYSADLSI